MSASRWKVVKLPSRDVITIMTEDDDHIADMTGRRKDLDAERAARICAEHNAYAALVERIETTNRLAEKMMEGKPKTSGEYMALEALLLYNKAALKLAKEDA